MPLRIDVTRNPGLNRNHAEAARSRAWAVDLVPAQGSRTQAAILEHKQSHEKKPNNVIGFSIGNRESTG